MMTVKEKREIIIRYVNSVLRKRSGGNEGAHCLIDIYLL